MDTIDAGSCTAFFVLGSYLATLMILLVTLQRLGVRLRI